MPSTSGTRHLDYCSALRASMPRFSIQSVLRNVRLSVIAFATTGWPPHLGHGNCGEGRCPSKSEKRLLLPAPHLGRVPAIVVFTWGPTRFGHLLQKFPVAPQLGPGTNVSYSRTDHPCKALFVLRPDPLRKCRRPWSGIRTAVSWTDIQSNILQGCEILRLSSGKRLAS